MIDREDTSKRIWPDARLPFALLPFPAPPRFLSRVCVLTGRLMRAWGIRLLTPGRANGGLVQER